MNLKAEYVYGIIQGQELSTRQSQQSLFYKAYASMDRLEGKCNLTVVWRGRSYRKETEVHNYQLRFNHEGIKDYKQKKIYQSGRGEGTLLKQPACASLSLAEAAALIQDSYIQNVRFGTRPAAGYKHYGLMLEYDTSAIDRGCLFRKLAPQYLTPRMLANVILTALRKMDNVLLYDLSGPQRRALLGDRNEFLLRHGEEYRHLSFLKTGVTAVNKDEKGYWIKAYALVSTPQEQLLRLSFRFKVVHAEDRFCLEEFVVTNSEELAGDHPDNPLNYDVFCSVYRLKSGAAVKRWLENDPDIFMIGEMSDCQCFKWMQNRELAWLEYDITDKILAEFIVTRHELVIYAKKPYHLARVEKTAALKAPGCIDGYMRVYLTVSKLYTLLFGGERNNHTGQNKTALRKYRAASALLRIRPNNTSFQFLQDRIEYKVMLGPKCWYLFCRRKADAKGGEILTEYYITDNWLLVNAITGDLAEVIADLATIPGTDVILGAELENHYDLFHPPVSEERKWQIYGLLKQFHKEGGLLREMGLAPSLHDVVQIMGTLKRTR